jgi:hypothetical protein
MNGAARLADGLPAIDPTQRAPNQSDKCLTDSVKWLSAQLR